MAVKVTVRDIAEAMVRDQTPKIVGELYKKVRGVTHTCAIGGAALELGLNGGDLFDKLGRVDKDGVTIERFWYSSGYRTLGILVFHANDSTPISKAEIGQAILDTADEETLNTVLSVKARTARKAGITASN